MNREEIMDKLVDIICATYNVPLNKEEITLDTRLMEDLGMDSIKVLEMVVYLEDEFELEFNEDDLILDNLRTIGLTVSTIEKCLNEG